MPNIKAFTELGKNDAPTAGGKGASLGEMTQAGIPVPPGFVILADAFERFITETDLTVEIDSILSKVNHQEMHTIEHASETIQGLILNVEMPADLKEEIETSFKNLGTEFVAVRSSATAEDGADHAWAGQLDTFLNTTEETLIKNVNECWASLFTPRAIFYRFEKSLHASHISVAVVVQKMVQSEKSGIAFSVHPVTEDHNQLIIEAGFGLGEAIVSGSVTPDSYVVEKEPRKIVDSNVNEQTRALYRSLSGGNEWRELDSSVASSQVLTTEEILELSELILKIEQHYHFPCDIEWAHEAGEFYITQSRPITTLKLAEAADSSGPITKKIKTAVCQNDWEGPFSLFHLSFATKGYFERFKRIFGKNIDFVYVVYKEGVAAAYLPIDSYEAVGVHLAERMRDKKFLEDTTATFKKTADEITAAMNSFSFENFFENSAHIQDLYDQYTAYQVGTKTAANFLDPKKDKEIFEELEEARKYSETFFSMADTKINETIASAVKKFPEYTLEQFSFLTLKELMGTKENKELPTPAELSRRREKCGIYLTEGTLTILGESAVDEIQQSWFSSAQTGDGVQGTTAYPGVVQGRCRIIASYEGALLEEGEILVTGMTDPNFVPLMKKAAAIVTDGGGLLCHAAIVARELKKPCVIGTRFATHIFKDGDLVEVDANSGVVRLLNSTSLKFKPEEYARMFANKSFGLLFSDIFLLHYTHLGVLSVQNDEQWMSFIPKKTREQTEQEGRSIYTDPRKFKEYITAFESYKQAAADLFTQILSKKNLSDEDVRAFLTKAGEHFEFYSKTEFFYTDLVTEHDMVPTVKEFDELKLGGREFLNKIMFEESGYAKTLLSRLAEQTKLSIDMMSFYTIEELCELVKTGTAVSDDLIAARREGFILDGHSVFAGQEIKENIEALFKSYREVSKVIRGTIANKGKVTAKARVLVPDFSDFNKIAIEVQQMEEGEVLVAETTAPEIIVACKKASAIVTNQGGMLSHAAIVSRELGIPCVIGTDKDVILNIKTGDMVEVDANVGIVRILT